jgi:hypothetical protein
VGNLLANQRGESPERRGILRPARRQVNARVRKGSESIQGVTKKGDRCLGGRWLPQSRPMSKVLLGRFLPYCLLPKQSGETLLCPRDIRQGIVEGAAKARVNGLALMDTRTRCLTTPSNHKLWG